MYVIEQKCKHWRGNYWTTNDEWYEWEKASEFEEFADEETALNVARDFADNPYIVGVRVVNKENGKVVREFQYWIDKVEEK